MLIYLTTFFFSLDMRIQNCVLIILVGIILLSLLTFHSPKYHADKNGRIPHLTFASNLKTMENKYSLQSFSLLQVDSEVNTWNLQMINIYPSWNITMGSEDVVVAIIDSGIIWGSYELPTSLRWENKAELSGDVGIDDDGNGYIDDFYGYDFDEYDNDPSTDQSGDNLHQHGTNVAGIIAAQHNNKSIAGIAPNIRIMNLRVLDVYNSFSGFYRIIDAFNYAMEMNASVINFSIYFNGEASFNLKQTFQQVIKARIPIVGIAGNSWDGDEAINPGKEETIIASAALYEDGEPAFFSLPGEHVELAAPGHQVPTVSSVGSTRWVYGTSFAAPHVTGTIALMKSVRNDLDVETCRNVLRYTATDIDLPGKDINTGYGLINTYQAVQAWLNYENWDFDNDSLPTGWELKNKLNPYLNDSDSDGLTDAEEIKIYKTNPLKTDTDHDGINDGEEVLNGLDPLIPNISNTETNIYSSISSYDSVSRNMTQSTTKTTPFAEIIIIIMFFGIFTIIKRKLK